MPAIADRVKETTTTTGNGNITLAGASAQFQSFNTAFGTANPFYYVIVDGDGSAWEIGTGELSAATTLVRSTVHQSSNSDNKIVLSANTHTVFCAAPEVFLSGLAPKSGKLSQFAATTSSELAGVISDETGSGALVFGTSPTISNPVVTGGSIDNTPIGATTKNTGAFTTLSATGNVDFNGGTFVFNESGADKDLRIEGDADANLLFTDASTDRVGVGTNTPGSKFTVAGTIESTTGGLKFPDGTTQTTAATAGVTLGTVSALSLNIKFWKLF